MWEILILAVFLICLMVILALFDPVRLANLDAAREERKFARMQMKYERKLEELRKKYESQAQPRSYRRDNGRQFQQQICSN